MGSSRVSLVKHAVPEKYPRTCDNNSPNAPNHRSVDERFVLPCKLSYKWLMQAVAFAAHNVQVGCWKNKGTMTTYLQVCSVPEKVREDLWKDLQAAQVRGTEIDEQMLYPDIWRSTICMSAFIECGMHHIFRGVVKDCIVVMNAFMTHHNLYASFERAINPYLQELKRLRLTWCHVKTFPMTLWQAEDELGFARIQQFVYAVFFTNVFSLPMNSNTNKESILALKMIINALSVMVHGLMTPRDTSTYFIDRHVKVFLSCCHKFCQAYYSDGVTEFWSTTANFPLLLNLAEQVKNHGRLRWYWDGTRERYIQSVKKILKNLCKSPSYFTRKLELMQKLTWVSWLRVTLPDLDEDDDKMIRNYDESRMYFRYRSYEEFFNCLPENRFFPGSLLKGENKWCLCRLVKGDGVSKI